MSWKQHFSLSIGRSGAPLHFAAHSHHPWPDVSRAAQIEYWQDSNLLLDHKWEKIFGKVIPEAQLSISRELSLSDSGSVCFAPNTHDFLIRVLSCLPAGRTLNILTTDSEFHSFTRQSMRLEEEGLACVTRLKVEPFDTFHLRMQSALQDGTQWDLLWLSHVFFSTGHLLPLHRLEDIIQAVPTRDTIAVIDGYHAFSAIPLDLSSIQSRVFYVAGGYKYAMAGEGVCFMHCPDGIAARPRVTGWFAEFGALESGRSSRVAYAPAGARFYGATFDPSGLYRFNAVRHWLDQNALTTEKINDYCKDLQRGFLSKLASKALNGNQLCVPSLNDCARFLSFRTERAGELSRKLVEKNIIVDHRGDLLRVGFGIYQDADDVERLASLLNQMQ